MSPKKQFEDRIEPLLKRLRDEDPTALTEMGELLRSPDAVLAGEAAMAYMDFAASIGVDVEAPILDMLATFSDEKLRKVLFLARVSRELGEDGKIH